MQRIRISAAGVIVSAATACAADVTGAWRMITRTPDGYKHESTLNLRSDGSKLTGKIVSRRGSVEIANGAINGNNISFMIVRAGNGDELKIEFEGTVEGGTMKLRMQYRDHDPVELIGRRGAISEHK